MSQHSHTGYALILSNQDLLLHLNFRIAIKIEI